MQWQACNHPGCCGMTSSLIMLQSISDVKQVKTWTTEISQNKRLGWLHKRWAEEIKRWIMEAKKRTGTEEGFVWKVRGRLEASCDWWDFQRMNKTKQRTGEERNNEKRSQDKKITVKKEITNNEEICERFIEAFKACKPVFHNYYSFSV